MLAKYRHIYVSTPSGPGLAAELVQTLNRVQAEVKQTFDRITSNPRLDYVTGSVTLAGASDSTIAHRLGRQPIGWSLTDVSNPSGPLGTIYRVAWDDKTITLYAPVGCDAQLEVW